MSISTKHNRSKGRSLSHRTTHGDSAGMGAFKYDAFHIVLGRPGMEQPAEDLFKSLKAFLIIGRFLGIIPYSGVFSKSYTHLYF